MCTDQLSSFLAALSDRVTAFLALFSKAGCWQREQHPIRRGLAVDKMLDFFERRECKWAIVEPEIGRAAHCTRPAAHPPPERKFRMSLEPPTVRGAHIAAPGAAVVQVVAEEPVQHVHVAQVAQGLGGRSELDVVVRGGGCGAKQPIGKLAIELRDLRAARSVEVLQDARFVVRGSHEVIGAEQVQTLVVDDVDAAAHLPVARLVRLDAEFLSFPRELRANGEGGFQKDVAACPAHDVMRPHQLLQPFAEAAVLEQRRAALAQRPLHHEGLEREQKVRHPDGLESMVAVRLGFIAQELQVGIHQHRSHAGP